MFLNDENEENTKVKLELAIRTRPARKKDFLLCVKPIYGRALNENDFLAWIEFNKRIGFDTIQIFNNSIPESHKHIFAKHKGFVILKPYHFYPHFYENQYKNCHVDYIENFVNASHLMKDANEQISFNECYLSNKYNYEKIAILDPDEKIVPVKNRNQSNTCSRTNTNKTDLRQYLDELSKIEDYKNACSYWFPHENFIPYSKIDKIMILLKEVVFGDTKSFEFETDAVPFKLLKFNLTSENDLNHAINLLALYKKQKYLLQKHKNRQFAAAFSVSRPNAYPSDGKSMHFTDKVKYVETHGALGCHRSAAIKKISRFHGFTAHFRDKLVFYGEDSILILNITSFVFKSNYFDCFYLSIN